MNPDRNEDTIFSFRHHRCINLPWLPRYPKLDSSPHIITNQHDHWLIEQKDRRFLWAQFENTSHHHQPAWPLIEQKTGTSNELNLKINIFLFPITIIFTLKIFKNFKRHHCFNNHYPITTTVPLNLILKKIPSLAENHKIKTSNTSITTHKV